MKKVPLKSTALNSSKPTGALKEKVLGAALLQFVNNFLVVSPVLLFLLSPHLQPKPRNSVIPVRVYIFHLPTARPGSQLTVWTSSLPWWRTTQFGSFWDVPLGSRGIIWNLRKSVSLMSTFSGQISSMSGTLSWSKSSLQASPRPSPAGQSNFTIRSTIVVCFWVLQLGVETLIAHLTAQVLLADTLQKPQQLLSARSVQSDSDLGISWKCAHYLRST